MAWVAKVGRAAWTSYLPLLRFPEIPVVDSGSQEVWACRNLLNLQLKKKTTNNPKRVLDASTRKLSGNIALHNEVVNHISL